MVMGTCKGACHRLEIPYGCQTYLKSKRCIPCKHWFSPNTLRCPCCGLKLRGKPRCKLAIKHKIQYQKEVYRDDWK